MGIRNSSESGIWNPEFVTETQALRGETIVRWAASLAPHPGAFTSISHLLQPNVSIGIKCRRFVRMRFAERLELPQNRLIATIRSLDLPMRHLNERSFHFPYVLRRKPPITLDQRSQIGNAIAFDAPGAIHIRVHITHHQMAYGPEHRLAPVQSGITRARHGSPASSLFEKE